MKLSEALLRIRQQPPGDPLDCFLVCGFTPNTFATFLQAALIECMERAVNVKWGLFGDFVGNIDLALRSEAAQVAIAMEWSDLDPRLGFRTSGGWRGQDRSDIGNTIVNRLSHIQDKVQRLAEQGTRIGVSLPTLPLPPLFPTPTSQIRTEELLWHGQLQQWAAELTNHTSVSIVHPQLLDRRVGSDHRYSARSDFSSGFPYELKFASVLADALAQRLVEVTPLKGLITDLDNTLWRGILGEDGVDGVSWHLETFSHGHALYQEMLATLANIGVLVGVATRNDPQLVAQALRRPDMIVPADLFFPVEAHWAAKSSSIRNILDTWNIGAETVVFIDDDPLQLAEVAALHPEITCYEFPTHNDDAIVQLLRELRDRFGKTTVNPEDRIRIQSLRSAGLFRQAGARAEISNEFLAEAEATLELEFDEYDPRAYELINKSNQFNLNGERIDLAAWTSLQPRADRILVTATYNDKFGPLGKIAVVAVERPPGGEPHIDTWVLSCRAFARRIEYQVLDFLFNYLEADRLMLKFTRTERNEPFCDFLTKCQGETSDVAERVRVLPAGKVEWLTLSRSEFFGCKPATFAKLTVRDGRN